MAAIQAKTVDQDERFNNEELRIKEIFKKQPNNEADS